MNYWMAQAANLRECHRAAILYIDHLRKSGRKSARAYFNARGWFASKKSDIWGFTKPYASGVYGYFVGGSAWLCEDVWEYYWYTQDEVYLDTIAFPILEEAVEFYLDFLVKNEDGYYMANPSASPENSFLYEEKAFWLCEGTEINHRLIESLFQHYLEACRILRRDGKIKEQAEQIGIRLMPTQIGKNGTILEWDREYEEKEPTHRHLSSLYLVYPGHGLEKADREIWRKAAEKTMIGRGYSNVGWSKVWKAAIWARLYDAKRAYDTISEFVENSLYNNLFCAGPPYQIDGNLGYAAALIECLIQGDETEIHLLPCLPDRWKKGCVRGLCVRGGYEVAFCWEDGLIKDLTITVNQKQNAHPILVHKNGERIWMMPEERK